VFDSCVLGVDPGVAATGLAAVGVRERRPVLLWSETVRTPPGLAESARLRLIHEAVRSAVRDMRPSSLAVERVAWNRNQVSALQVARATGVVMLAAAQSGLAVTEYAPSEVKLAVTGAGNADKAQVRRALSRIHGLAEVPAQADAADAVAVALCHLTHRPLRIAAAGAR
jgi:crossover junction endodeoxyribonuclease RuvC